VNGKMTLSKKQIPKEWWPDLKLPYEKRYPSTTMAYVKKYPSATEA
jgi:hypothetical protein